MTRNQIKVSQNLSGLLKPLSRVRDNFPTLDPLPTRKIEVWMLSLGLYYLVDLSVLWEEQRKLWQEWLWEHGAWPLHSWMKRWRPTALGPQPHLSLSLGFRGEGGIKQFSLGHCFVSALQVQNELQDRFFTLLCHELWPLRDPFVGCNAANSRTGWPGGKVVHTHRSTSES